jgi:hypothetical protein
MVNLWWECGDFVVNGWSFLRLKNTPRILDLFFGDSRFGNGFLPGGDLLPGK